MANKTRVGVIPTLIALTFVGGLLMVVPKGKGTGPGTNDRPDTVLLTATFDPSPRPDLIQVGHAVNGGSMAIENTEKTGWTKVVAVDTGDTVEFLVAQPPGSQGWVQCEIKRKGVAVARQRSNREHLHTAYCVWTIG